MQQDISQYLEKLKQEKAESENSGVSTRNPQTPLREQIQIGLTGGNPTAVNPGIQQGQAQDRLADLETLANQKLKQYSSSKIPNIVNGLTDDLTQAILANLDVLDFALYHRLPYDERRIKFLEDSYQRYPEDTKEQLAVKNKLAHGIVACSKAKKDHLKEIYMQNGNTWEQLYKAVESIKHHRKREFYYINRKTGASLDVIEPNDLIFLKTSSTILLNSLALKNMPP